MAGTRPGPGPAAVAARLGVSRTTVTKWRPRFLRERLDGLIEDPRPGVPRTTTDAQAGEVKLWNEGASPGSS